MQALLRRRFLPVHVLEQRLTQCGHPLCAVIRRKNGALLRPLSPARAQTWSFWSGNGFSPMATLQATAMSPASWWRRWAGSDVIGHAKASTHWKTDSWFPRQVAGPRGRSLRPPSVPNLARQLRRRNLIRGSRASTAGTGSSTFRLRPHRPGSVDQIGTVQRRALIPSAIVRRAKCSHLRCWPEALRRGRHPEARVAAYGLPSVALRAVPSLGWLLTRIPVALGVTQRHTCPEFRAPLRRRSRSLVGNSGVGGLTLVLSGKRMSWWPRNHGVRLDELLLLARLGRTMKIGVLGELDACMDAL
mmetsp:Transcript_87443/g.234163  ORF Transcript_87443/g.234163 Transcript_87443/m.234163 type:complete len:302 (+) Transcript_87443:470-1375(+)